jgi:hypothetical protein
LSLSPECHLVAATLPGCRGSESLDRFNKDLNADNLLGLILHKIGEALVLLYAINPPYQKVTHIICVEKAKVDTN